MTINIVMMPRRVLRRHYIYKMVKILTLKTLNHQTEYRYHIQYTLLMLLRPLYSRENWITLHKMLTEIFSFFLHEFNSANYKYLISCSDIDIQYKIQYEMSVYEWNKKKKKYFHHDIQFQIHIYYLSYFFIPIENRYVRLVVHLHKNNTCIFVLRNTAS